MKKLLGILLALALLLGYAVADQQKVIIVYYDDNTFVTEDGKVHKEYEDLVPGDVIDISNESWSLVSQSNWVFFEYRFEEDLVAAFLYPEDAVMVYDHFYEELP